MQPQAPVGATGACVAAGSLAHPPEDALLQGGSPERRLEGPLLLQPLVAMPTRPGPHTANLGSRGGKNDSVSSQRGTMISGEG